MKFMVSFEIPEETIRNILKRSDSSNIDEVIRDEVDLITQDDGQFLSEVIPQIKKLIIDYHQYNEYYESITREVNKIIKGGRGRRIRHGRHKKI